MYRAYSTSDIESPKAWKADILKPVQVPSSAPSTISAVTNETLGFEKILVLSVGPSWRTRGLAAAANLTGLDFTILPQRQHSDELVHAFQHKASGVKGRHTPPFGSAKAWLAHLDLLKHFISSGLETALIVEDDLDWDVSLRTRQMQLVVDNVRNFTGVRPDDLSTSSPYGDNWDVIWLGHCGCDMRPITNSLVPVGWPPAALPYFDPLRLNGTRKQAHWVLEKIGWPVKGWVPPPNGLRLVQDGGAVCTWAYAVSRRSVEKVLARMVQGDDYAFDLALKDACDHGVLNCVTVLPGVMSTYSPPADLGYKSLVNVGDGKGKKGDEAKFEGVKGTTSNIVSSARCKALFAEQCIPPGALFTP
ncbi:uncharacterized protein PG998_005686 [Apiospora kogelbergensis]|uniref:uncharacterized protein n=1 Tax=Apiospora kogelbergensis TaxID=1337665 RepID=UPI00312EBC20